MNSLPIYELELRATEERRRLQSSVTELKSRLRENLDVSKTARRHVWLAREILAALGLRSGYALKANLLTARSRCQRRGNAVRAAPHAGSSARNDRRRQHASDA